MIIETYIDTQDLTNNQSLVIVDDQGRQRDAEEALNLSPTSSAGGGGQAPRPQVILERWVVKLGEPPNEVPRDLAQLLPRVYKNSIILYRSLFACARLLPAWQKFGKKLFNSRSSPNSPKLRYRILEGPQARPISMPDPLSTPLFESRDEVLDRYSFDPIESPAGAISIHVTYRSRCDFRIDDSEAFLSSRFMGMDKQYFEPSLGRKGSRTRKITEQMEVGSLPPKRELPIRTDQGQAYGSMSTFHQIGPPAGTSPLSALRAARVAGSESPEDMAPKKTPANTRSAQGSRSSLRSADGAPNAGRRPSVSFMPFKTPSLSASPSQAEQMMTSVPRGSQGKSSPLAALAEVRAPSSLGPYGSVPMRGSPNANEQAIPASTSTSPKPPPPTRYSSSFGHRKAKLSIGGSRTEDDNSSGKASIASSTTHPGSIVLAEAAGTSSGSVQTDDDNISEFLKLIDQKKDLKSFRKSNDAAATEASTRRTRTALNKFQRMRDSNAALSESMSSSLLLHRSSSSSSRHLSSVPAMVAGTSASPSSSPGKPISPQTPHTPAVPSRLSANSIAEYPHRVPSRDRGPRPNITDGASNPRSARDRSTGPIDIPSSPRPFRPNYHRSSSVAQQPRAVQLDDDVVFPFGMRSASLGVDDRPPLSLNALAGSQDAAMQDDSAVAAPSLEQQESGFGPVYGPAARTFARRKSTDSREEAGSVPIRGAPYRPRINRGSGRGNTPPQGSSSSLVERGSGSGGSDQRGGRYSFSRPPSTFEEEEPLLFAMSDFDATQQPRRSLEEGQWGGKTERGSGDSGASSRRGSRRGGF